jgi:hypothetical protein
MDHYMLWTSPITRKRSGPSDQAFRSYALQRKAPSCDINDQAIRGVRPAAQAKPTYHGYEKMPVTYGDAGPRRGSLGRSRDDPDFALSGFLSRPTPRTHVRDPLPRPAAVSGAPTGLRRPDLARTLPPSAFPGPPPPLGGRGRRVGPCSHPTSSFSGSGQSPSSAFSPSLGLLALS